MNNVIDFQSARIRLRSNIKDPVIIQDMLDNAYDPCNPEDVHDYWMRENLVDSLREGLTFTYTQDYNFQPNFSLFSDDDNK